MNSSNLTSRISISLAGFASILMFTWPLFIQAKAVSEGQLAQGVFIALMPLLVLLILVEFASGDIDSRQLAVLAVLIALNAVIRILGAGTAGIETAFFVILIAAYVFGSGFGFILGTGSLFVSALISGGVGPWLPFQMMAAGLIGIGAGLLPKFKARRAQVAILILYAIFASFIYGALMTMWNWPFLAGNVGDLAYSAGAGILTNLVNFLNYEIITGGLLWDLGRAITTSVLILLSAPALLTTLERAANKAGFVKTK